MGGWVSFRFAGLGRLKKQTASRSATGHWRQKDDGTQRTGRGGTGLRFGRGSMERMLLLSAGSGLSFLQPPGWNRERNCPVLAQNRLLAQTCELAVEGACVPDRHAPGCASGWTGASHAKAGGAPACLDLPRKG